MHPRLKRLSVILAAAALAGCSGDLLGPIGSRRAVITPPAHAAGTGTRPRGPR